jgi:recombination protein RecT
MSNGASKNAPVVMAAQQIKKARKEFEQMATRTKSQLVFEREAKFALEIIQNSEKLQSCDPATVYSSIVNVSALGLSLNPVLGEAALIPRWNRNKRMNDCTLSPMYRGLVRLATESGRVTHVKAELVFELDEIDMSLGANPDIKHNPMPSIIGGEAERVVDFINRERNKLRAVYVVAHLNDESKIIGVMSYDEILKVAMCSEAFNPRPDRNGKKRSPYGPWLEHPGEMAKKALINREQKTWPRAGSGPDRLDAAVEVMQKADENEGLVSNQNQATLLIEDHQVEQIRELAERQNLSLERVCAVAEADELEEIPADRFDEIKQKLEDRLDKYIKAKAEAEAKAAEAEAAEEEAAAEEGE